MDIENPMVIDNLWNDKHPKVVGECAGCQEEIYENEERFYYPNGNVLIHMNHECIYDFVADISIYISGNNE